MGVARSSHLVCLAFHVHIEPLSEIGFSFVGRFIPAAKEYFAILFEDAALFGVDHIEEGTVFGAFELDDEIEAFAVDGGAQVVDQRVVPLEPGQMAALSRLALVDKGRWVGLADHSERPFAWVLGEAAASSGFKLRETRGWELSIGFTAS